MELSNVCSSSVDSKVSPWALSMDRWADENRKNKAYVGKKNTGYRQTDWPTDGRISCFVMTTIFLTSDMLMKPVTTQGYLHRGHKGSPEPL